MATEQEKAAVRRWFVEGTNPAIFDEVLAPDVVMSMKGMEQPLKGVEAVKQLGMTMGTAFPDLFLSVDQMTDQGDTITVHWTGQGTHTGDLRLPTGVTVPPTGKRVTFTATDTVRVSGGKIIEDRSGFDVEDLLQQLGVNTAS